SGVAAYAFSFGLDILIASVIGFYPSRPYASGALWFGVGAAFHFISRSLTRSSYAMIIPYGFFGLVALVGGIIGHSFNLLVALALLTVAAVFLYGRLSQRLGRAELR